MGCFDFLCARESRRGGSGGRSGGCCLGGLCGCSSCCGGAGAASSQGGTTADSAKKAAHAQAREGLKEVLKGYRKIAQLALPPGAALLFAGLRRNLVELEALIAEAEFPKARPWLLPLPNEQHDWEELYPDGGILLRRQVCMASSGDDEWFLGGLFISDLGVVFDTGDAADATVCFQTGFLPWRSIQNFERPGMKTEVALALAPGCQAYATLRLQLSIVGDVEWMQEFWKLSTAKGHGLDTSVPSEHDVIQVPLATARPRLLLGPGAGDTPPRSPRGQPQAQRGNSILKQRIESQSALTSSISGVVKRSSADSFDAGPQPYRVMSSVSNVSALYADAPGGRLGAQVPQVEAIREEHLPSLALEKVSTGLRKNGLLPSAATEAVKARDITATGWSESKRTPGMWVRKAHFTIPLPQDFPKAVTRLVKLPEESTVTAVYRLHISNDSVVMTTQTCSHDVPYGENFRVHETLMFKSSGTGVRVTKWAEIMWVADLPWTHGMLKGIIDKKAKADSATNLGPLLALLQK
uniref:VASt domain-containing protein n=1 Tax=Zooxanthella nutricula TaxID=1333877 RepID=A0A7S2M632_9DINO